MLSPIFTFHGAAKNNSGQQSLTPRATHRAQSSDVPSDSHNKLPEERNTNSTESHKLKPKAKNYVSDGRRTRSRGLSVDCGQRRELHQPRKCTLLQENNGLNTILDPCTKWG